jgi:glutathione S-transferase
MIRVHHLNDSRSQRILWLLEELEIPYEIVPHQRNAHTRLAPPELKDVHPLGKSPVIVEDGKTIAESGAIAHYLAHKYGGGRLSVAAGDPEWADYLHWLHFAEGSAMLPLMLALYVGFLGDNGAPLHPRIFGEIANHLSYMNAALEGRDYFVANRFTAADVQNTFVLEGANATGRLSEYPNLVRYLAAMQGRDAYKRAIERGGPYALAR